MKIPRTRLRSTVYHMVVASSLPWMRSHGRAGGSTPSAIPAAISCLTVAT